MYNRYKSEYYKKKNKKKINSQDDVGPSKDGYSFDFDINDNNGITYDEINQTITENEILAAIKSLKNNKSTGLDNIVNEHLKSTIQVIILIYKKLFNLILDTGIVPESWTCGVIKLIFENKSNPADPGKYCPITLLSCFGKFFYIHY